MLELMRSFGEFVPVGSTVTFISQLPPDKHWPTRLGNVSRFNYVIHPHPTSTEVGGSGKAAGTHPLAYMTAAHDARQDAPWGSASTAGARSIMM